MARNVFRHSAPDRFVAGTVGPPGERAFYLQARTGSSLHAVALEKGQVAELAERIDELLDRVRTELPESSVPARGSVTGIDVDPLEVPLVAEFQVVTLALGWDQRTDEVVIEARGPEPDDEEGGSQDPAAEAPAADTLHVRLTPQVARAFAERSRRVVAAGRPPCPVCQQPLDPSGHICPRANGYRR